MHSLEHPGIHQIPDNDVEKWGEKSTDINVTIPSSDTSPDPTNISPSFDSSSQHNIRPTPLLLNGRLANWNAKVESLAGLEARGITRVLPEEKYGGGRRGYLQMFALWLSMNMAVTNIITGLLGPLVFKLGWVDCICIVIFANALSSCGVSYTSTFGPQSGNRTMIIGRYFMGYWPSKLACILNLIMQIGWGIIGCIIAGQMFSAVNGGGLSVAVGCIVSAFCIGFIATFGIAIVHTFERYAFIPQLFAILVLIGSAWRNFDTSVASVGPAGTITANRCSFFALEFANVIGLSAIAADFYVYYPATTSKRLTLLMTWSGLWVSETFCDIVGVAIATGVATTPVWNDAYNVSSGALLLACYDGLGGFGGFCVVILALGSISNYAPCTYAAALTAQVLGRYAKAIPRWVWCVIITLIELVCSVAGRNHLFNIFENFLPIMSYWVCPWITIALEEHLLFHVLRGVPFDWTAWEDKKKMPIGAAALFAWLVGWAGAIIGMDQVWYQGSVALKIGGYGGDIGAWMSIAFACVTYPPLRYLELRKVGR